MSEEKKRLSPLIVSGLPQRILKGTAVVLGLLFIGGLFFLLWAFKTGRAVEAVRQEILTELHDTCGVEATFTSLSLDPIERELDLTDLKMRHLDGRPIVSVEEALVQLQLLPLFYGRLQLERVAVLAPEATIEMKDGRILNLPRCVQPPEDAPAQQAVALGVSELTVERGRFDLLIDEVFEGHFVDIGITLRPGRSGGAEVAIGVDDGKLKISGKDLPLHRFRALGHLGGALTDPRALLLDKLVVDLAKVTVEGEASVDLLGPVYEAKLSVEAPLDAIHDFTDAAPVLTGDLALTAEVAGTAINPRGAGRLLLKGVSVDGVGIGDEVDVEFRVDKERAELVKLAAKLGDGTVDGSGRVTFDEHVTTSVEADADNVSFGLLLDTLGVKHPWIDYRINDASVNLSGPLLPAPKLDGTFVTSVRDLGVYDRPYDSPQVRGRPPSLVDPSLVIFNPRPIQVSGRWGFTEEGLNFSDGHLTCGATEGFAEASIDFAADGGFKIVANLTRVDWIDLGPVAGLAFGGFGSLSGVLEGSYDDFGAVGTLEMQDISIAGIPFGRASGNLVWHDMTSLDFTGIEGRLGQSSYRGTVGVVVEGAVPLSISGEIPKGRVQDILVPFGVDAAQWGDAAGEVFARFDLQGPVDRLTGPIDASFENVSVVGEAAERARVVGRMEMGKVVAEAVEITKHDARITGQGWIDLNKGNVRASVRTHGAHLQDLDVIRSSQPKLDGALAASIDLSGSLRGVTGTVAVSLSGARAGPLRLGGGRLKGALRGATLEVAGSLFERAIGVDGQIRIGAGLPYRASLDIRDLPVPNIVAGLANHQRWKGTAVARADLSGSLVDWHLSSGRIALERAELKTPSLTIATAAPARFQMQRGVLHTKRLSLSGPRTQFTASGRFGAHLLDLRTSGRVDLAIAELVSPSVEKAGGTLTIDSAIGGTPSNLNLVGTGRVDGAFLQWRGFSSRLTGVTADLTFSQSSVLIDRAQGRWAGGRLSMTGNVLLEKFYPKRLSLQIDVAGVRPRFSYPKVDLSGTLNGRLNADGTFERLLVRGDLDVKSSRIRPKVSLANLVRGGQSVDVYDPAAETVLFDIELEAKEPIRIKNDEADVELLGTIRLTGTNERFGMLGVANLVKGGRVALFGPEYEVESGTIELRDRYKFAPKYDVVVTAEACDARIRANVVGTLESFSTAYSSSPEMEHNDLVSCFIRGIRVRNLDEDFGAFAGSALLKLSGVDQEVKKVIPIDQIDVTSEYSSEARGYEPRVLLGKNLSILDRQVRLEYSSPLVPKGNQRAAVRVRLTPRLNLQFGWEESKDVTIGDWGLDLKQRWEW